MQIENKLMMINSAITINPTQSQGYKPKTKCWQNYFNWYFDNFIKKKLHIYGNEQRLHLPLVYPRTFRIITHPGNYPGKHQSSQPRTNEAVKPLDPKSQFHLVIRALGHYIKENIEAGRGINYRNFGAFAFEVDTDKVKPAQHSNFDITKDLSNQR